MSQNFSNARKEATNIPRYIKQGNLTSAVKALRGILQSMTSKNLLRQEREEGEKLIENGLFSIMFDPKIKKEFLFELKYKAGNELEIIDYMNIILETLEEEIHAVEQEDFNQNLDEEQQKLELEKAFTFFKTGFFDKADEIFNTFAENKSISANSYADIAVFLYENAKFEPSVIFYEKALEIEPKNINWLNNLAMVLRKLKKFDQAEKKYFILAKNMGKNAPLLFNLARLYLEWEQLDKASKAAQAAVNLDPNFQEAQKLLRYIEKQQNK